MGRLLGVLIPFICILLCARSFRHRRANTKCLLSLILILGLFILGAASQIIPAGSAWRAAATMSLGCVAVVLIITSAVLAIIGLAEYRRRRCRYGRKRAILALCLVGVFLAAMVAGFIHGRNRVLGVAAASQAPGVPFVSSTLNFRYAVPAPWVRLDATRLNPSSALSLTRMNPMTYFTVIAERTGEESTINLPSVVELVKAHVQSAASSVNFLHEGPEQLHDMNGVRIDFDAEMQGHQFSYTQWIGVNHGIAYQLIGWTAQANRAALAGEAESMFGNFQLIDPNQETHSAGYVAAKDYYSLTNGYSVKLAGSNWTRPIPRLFQIAPHAEFGIEDSEGDALLVLPVPLGGHDPDLDALTAAFLGRFSTQYPGDAILDQKEIKHGPLEGYALTFTRTNASGDLRSRAEVLKGNGFAYLLIVSSSKKDDSADARMTDALSRVHFENAPAAPDLKLLMTRERKARADLFNAIGLAYYQDKKFDRAFEYCKEARALDGDNSVYALNTTDAFIQTGHYRAALDDLRAWLGARTPPDKLRARLAFLQSQTGAVDDALKTYSAIFDGGLRDDDYFSLYINLLAQSKQHDTAIAEIKKYLEQNDTIPIRLMLANVYRQAGHVDQALDALRQQQDKYPENRQIGDAIAQVFIDAGRYAEAVEQCTKLCADGRGTALIYFLKGRAEYGLKHYRESKASLEAALKIEPANADIKAVLDHVSGMLGEGSNTALETPVDPVAIPASLLVTSTAAIATATGSFGGYYDWLVKAIEYVPGKEFKTTETRRIKVLDESGVTAFSSFEVPFDPLSEEIYVNELTVKDASGAVLATGKVSDYYVMDDTGGAEASQHKVVHIPVSGLRPGCEISLVITRRDLGSADAFRFSSLLFSKAFPILRSALFVRAPKGVFKAETYGNVTQRPLGDGVCWTVDHAPVYRWEPLQADVDTFMPCVWLSDPAATWKTVGKEYLDLIHDRLALDDDVRKVATEKIGGITRPEEKIAALARFVQKDFTYTAIEFGRRARIPNKASTTLQDRYGDCKDHAVLLRGLLDAAGIPAQIALVNAKGGLRKDMPSLDQFDHVIVYVPSLRGGSFIDCTDKDSDIGATVPLGLAKKDVLIIDDKESRLASIPDYPPESNAVTSTRSIEILNDADASVREDLKLEGPSAAYFRGFLRRADPANRQAVLQQQMSASAPALEVHDLKFDNLDEPREPLIIRVAYLVKGKFRRVGDQLIGQLPAVWERMFLGSESVENRETPFTVAFPVSLQSSVALALPAGYKADPIPAAEIRMEFATCTASARQEPDAIDIDCNIHERAGHFAPSQYISYHDTLSRTLGAIETSILLRAVTK